MKVVRARDQLAELDREISRFSELNTYRVVSKFYPRSQHFTWRLVQDLPTPDLLRWGVMTGEIAHNLRSALDHLAWQLASLEQAPGRPATTTSFPIATSLQEWRSKGTRKRIKHIGRRHRLMLRRFQPYRRDDRPERSALARLQRLSNVDKHQVVHEAVFLPVGMEFQFQRWTENVTHIDDLQHFLGKPLVPDAKVLRARVATLGDDPPPEMEMKGDIQTVVAFSDRNEPDLYGFGVLEVLSAIEAEVAWWLDYFAAEFE